MRYILPCRLALLPRSVSAPPPSHAQTLHDRSRQDALRARSRDRQQHQGLQSHGRRARARDGGLERRVAGQGAEGRARRLRSAHPGARAAAHVGGSQVEKQASGAFLEKMSKEPGAVRSASGVDLHSRDRRHGREPDRGQHREGPLSRHAARRHRVRQLRAARRADLVPAERRDSVLDRGRAEDEGRRQGEARLPVRHRVRRQRLRARSRAAPRSCSKWSCSRSSNATSRARSE